MNKFRMQTVKAAHPSFEELWTDLVEKKRATIFYFPDDTLVPMGGGFKFWRIGINGEKQIVFAVVVGIKRDPEFGPNVGYKLVPVGTKNPFRQVRSASRAG